MVVGGYCVSLVVWGMGVVVCGGMGFSVVLGYGWGIHFFLMAFFGGVFLLVLQRGVVLQAQARIIGDVSVRSITG